MTTGTSAFVSRNMRPALLVLLGAVALAACSDDPSANAEAAPPVRPAKLLEITETQNTRVLNLPAVMSARSEAELTFEVNGTLEEFPVIEGQQVAEGDLIAQLDQRSFANDVSQAEAQFRNAQSNFSRAAQLVEKGTIARQTYDDRLAERDVARTTLDNARKRLEDSTLRAPFDGVIATKHVDQFQQVATQTPIVTIQSTGAAEAVVQVPATLVANSSQIEASASTVILDAAPDRPIPAELFSTATRTDPRSQTFEVRFSFLPPDDLVILPGMTGTLRADMTVSNVDGSLSRIAIPHSAVLAQGDDLFVWKVDSATMQVAKTQIEVSKLPEHAGENVTIVSGVDVGDTIVAAGVSYLSDGMQIRAFDQ